MTTNQDFKELLLAFENQADADRSKQMAAYMRDQFDFFGLPTPQRRAIYKDLIARDKKKKKEINWELLDLAWQAPQRELQYFVCDYLKGLQKYISYDDIPKLLTYASSKEWWDTIDHFDRIFGRIDDHRIDDVMRDFSQSDDFWIRRIAIDHQLGRKDQTKTDLLSEIILNNLGSKEFFINKAIGWSLRDYSKTNPDWVRSFVQKHQKELAPLSIREASKYI
ncbi:DNA alkylation repair protein [Streptococcus loxodontisalivarius]|uniref:3-methyladenine DNA glycosylase AlkD n=1 Tax=Streptococcus loxodontisalivarius TaxID=1349415 RepID=A0ABS2PU05_9STRE|nr:DNA alkylation repair protein [Streptococcus loxodontisalivarius]MBM7643524.1 3-methyladenine DNA glycosylase AlkD [Streptococcus loxodontisalivarius]